jgi:single-stranded-DNA-specific exonuclease
VAEADEARRLGLELIVTDHHEPKDTLPQATVLVHPRLPFPSPPGREGEEGGAYPFGGISGSGVALKLAWALCQRACGSEKVTPRFREFLLDAVMLAALGTVADVVPLHDENRIFVRHGLTRLHQSPSMGLTALLDAAQLGEKAQLNAADIGYKIAPRLNAAGRLGCARLVVELLTTTSLQRAVDLARYLEEQNQKRQQLERRILAQARETVEKCGLDGAPALVLANPDWHAGIIGIVAGRLTDLYARPVLLIAMRQERGAAAVVGQGSGRSVPGFPLHEALRACGEHLLSHGGHKAAAGFRIQPDQIDTFRERFCAYAANHFGPQLPSPRLVIDAEVPLSALTLGLLQDLDRLEPYGSSNHRPLFLAGGLQVVGTPRKVGGGERHLSFQVRQQGTTLKAIAFSMADRVEELMSAAGQCCLVFTPRLNEWQGWRSVDLEVTDFQAGPQARLG